MRVKSAFSGCAGTAGLAPLYPENVVREKLVFTRTLLFRYQFNPTDHARADDAELL